MKLTFDDLKRLERLADRCIATYRKTTGSPKVVEIEDLRQEALIALVEWEFDEKFSDAEVDAFLVQKTVFKLIKILRKSSYRNYKEPPKVTGNYDVETLVQPEQEDSDEETKREAIDQVLKEYSGRDYKLLLQYVQGRKLQELGNEFNITASRAGQIIERFRARVEFVYEHGQGVAIVDPRSEPVRKKDLKQCPLFFVK